MKPNRYDQWVAALRPDKQPPRLDRPIAAFVENEVLPDGRLGRVGTVIISNRECPYRCVFCGLWQDTTNETPLAGRVAQQVSHALQEFGPVDGIKLYNAGSFFDEAAIPPEDRSHVADLCRAIDWVIVEARPELIDHRAVDFAERLTGRLQIAIGLEAADDQILALLNKRMTLAMVRRAGRFAQVHGISLRMFIMVQPPLVPPVRAAELAHRSAQFSVECGADTVSFIRTYATPGAMVRLQAAGFWTPPSPWAVYDAVRPTLETGRLITLVDRWSLGTDPCCAIGDADFHAAFDRLNTAQQMPAVWCPCRKEYENSRPRDDIRPLSDYRRFLRHEVLRASSKKPLDTLRPPLPTARTTSP